MTTYRRAAVLVSAASLLVPLVGLATAPILARTLGAAGRGEAAAASAPYLLAVTGVTLGLPQAVTYLVAKRGSVSRALLVRTAVVTVVPGVAATIAVVLARKPLAAGDPELAGLVVIGALLIVPALVVGLLRAVSMGRQLWGLVAMERASTAVLRLAAIASLALTGRLDVEAVVLITCGMPVLAGLVHIAALLPKRTSSAGIGLKNDTPESLRALMLYGSTVWVGAVATMVMARLGELFVVPLSDAVQLGILVVAVTISDLPYILTQAIRDVVFGASSATLDRDRLAATSRTMTALTVLGCGVIALTLPWWLTAVFGGEFGAALVPTWLLLLASTAAVPGLIAGAGLDAAGRPGLRSVTLVGSLAIDFALMLALVPEMGALGAAVAVLVSALSSTIAALLFARSVLGVPVRAFVALGGSDVRTLADAFRQRAVRRPRGDPEGVR